MERTTEGGCTPGDERPGECGICSCNAEGAWQCEESCGECTPGAESDDGCNRCTCSADGRWLCTDRDCSECSPGETRLSSDGCNDCTCNASGQWACNQRCACVPGETVPQSDGCNTCVCADDGGGWMCSNRICSDCPAALVPPPNCVPQVSPVWAKDPSEGDCCVYRDACESPVDWPTFTTSSACEEWMDPCTFCAAENATATCVDGVCVLRCDEGFDDCNGSPTDGCEVNTSSSILNCGACWNICGGVNATASCFGGLCASTCIEGYADCDGDSETSCETNILTSLEHCGRCGGVCTGPNPICHEGTCNIDG